MEKLKVEILSIVNVKIQRLHIQYEDKLTDSEAPYTLGIALGESQPHSFHLPFTFVLQTQTTSTHYINRFDRWGNDA